MTVTAKKKIRKRKERDPAPKTVKGQMTRWLCKDGHRFISQYGSLTPKEWCEAEAKRTGAEIIETTCNGVNFIALTKA